jgi:hypothetical protein
VRVVLITTLISGLLFGAAWAAISYGLVDLAALLGRE